MLFPLAAVVAAVVALAVFGPVAHDGGAVKPSHGGLSVGIVQCEMRDAAVQDWRISYGESTWEVVVGKGIVVAAEDRYITNFSPPS